MKSTKPTSNTPSPGNASPLPSPALTVVVYRNPGPDDNAIEHHAQTVAEANSPLGIYGGLGYLTLVESDFDRVRAGIDRGDVLGTAYSVLVFLGPSARQFIGRHRDFIFGWLTGADEQYGTVLVLHIVPMPHLLAMMN